MPAPNSFFVIGSHVIGPLGVAILLFHIFRTFRTRFVLLWAIGFACLAIFRGSTAVVVAREGLGGREAPLILLSMFGGTAAYLQLGFFVWGCFEVARRRAILVRDAQRVLALLGVAGAVAGILPFVLGSDPAIHRFFASGLHAFAASATFAFCAIVIRRLRGRGFTVSGAGLLFYAAIDLAAFVSIMRSLMARPAPLPLEQLAAMDLIGSAVVALGRSHRARGSARGHRRSRRRRSEQLAYYDT